MKLMVMDGQGGGMGAAIIKGIRATMGLDLDILALGTNSIATSRMMKAGANKGGTGRKRHPSNQPDCGYYHRGPWQSLWPTP